MSNQLTEDSNYSEHIFLNYNDLLEKIIAALRGENQLFKLSDDRRRLIISIDSLATQIASLNPNSPLLQAEYHARVASVNFSPEFRDRFPNSIQNITALLTSKLDNYLTSQHFTLNELLNSLLDFRNSGYSFPEQPNLAQERLEIQPQPKGSTSALKLHKLTISVLNLNTFEQNLTEGLQNYLADYLDEEEELKRILEEKKDFPYLKTLVDTEVLGQLKKEACLKYLEYISSNISESKYPKIIYLKDLIRRLSLLKQYFNRTDVPDDYYLISYQGHQIDLRFSLAQANAFDALPIIPIVSGYLGETIDTQGDNREFIFGLKLKLNGKIEKYKGKSVLTYNLDLLNPDSKIHQEESSNSEKQEFFYKKVWHRFCLYFFAIASRCEPGNPDYRIEQELDYDPVSAFNRCFEILKGNDDQQKRNLLKTFSQALLTPKFQIEQKITDLTKLLKEFLKQETKLQLKEYPLHIEIQRGIITTDTDTILHQESFLKNPQAKQNLRYISIDEATINSEALCQFRAKVTIEDIRYHRTNQHQTFTMSYDLSDIPTLLVLFGPRNDIVRGAYNNDFKKYKLLNFPYDSKPDVNFNYYFTFALLCYLCLKIITDRLNVRLFIPILRLHLQGKPGSSQSTSNLESKIADYSKVLAHLLGMDHLANSQGLDVSNPKNYKTINAFSSLYSVIPKNFSFANPADTPTLDKAAIIVVSSGECDAKKGNSDRSTRIANLIAEVITIDLLPSKAVQIQTHKCLSANYTNQQLYREPTIILDTVSSLYHQGYRHILYLAKTPYTSSLHLSKSEASDNLFFLSVELIKYLHQDYQDLHLYPLFFEQYYVRKLSTGELPLSLSLQDTRQLQELLHDPSQRAVVFFNLFNGITVRTGEDTFYNGVISYATLVGIYKDILDDQAIRQNLIYNEGMKNDLLQYLTLYHFSRYEKSGSTNNPISLKLNPYQQIIGDFSVSKRSLCKHPQNQADFHLLAFLTEVRRALPKK
ncbi:hypothetical protein [Gloeocapsa sp. PCC 73106]|uniref:hypothetical protein n=1 Tax=Gloeocapsa sp. PCC 73106 TaxID=102232 RepID=UPI0002ABC9DE|nr:hypothetical protein [Gloeocapsa sp. PCC 73106]ELR97888.1 hypothetical protein GLO73106DRAFT_00017060 [Gloeocapsa sp. PCC 73106]